MVMNYPKEVGPPTRYKSYTELMMDYGKYVLTPEQVFDNILYEVKQGKMPYTIVVESWVREYSESYPHIVSTGIEYYEIDLLTLVQYVAREFSNIDIEAAIEGYRLFTKACMLSVDRQIPPNTFDDMCYVLFQDIVHKLGKHAHRSR